MAFLKAVIAYLLGFVALALISAQAFRAIHKSAGVIMIAALAYSYRAIRNRVSRELKRQ